MDYWRIVILGDNGVGKTNLAHNFTVIAWLDTEDTNDYRKQMVIDNKMCFVEVIDTGGQEEYTMLRTHQVPDRHGFILMYSISSRSTFESLQRFQQSMRPAKRSNANFMLVGNMCDKMYAREVSKEEGMGLAQQFGCEFLEVSAKTTQTMERLFVHLVRNLRNTTIVDPLPVLTQGKGKKKNQCIIL